MFRYLSAKQVERADLIFMGEGLRVSRFKVTPSHWSRAAVCLSLIANFFVGMVDIQITKKTGVTFGEMMLAGIGILVVDCNYTDEKKYFERF
jgi:hypothetical protein